MILKQIEPKQYSSGEGEIEREKEWGGKEREEENGCGNNANNDR